MSGIIPKKTASEDNLKKHRRFYVEVPRHVHLKIQEEAFSRDVQPHELGGSVLANWVEIGCPDSIQHSEKELA